MYDINGEEFQVGDTLKVIKSGYSFGVGDVLVCCHNDGSVCCSFYKVGADPEGDVLSVLNKRLQKL